MREYRVICPDGRNGSPNFPTLEAARSEKQWRDHTHDKAACGRDSHRIVYRDPGEWREVTT